MGQEREEQFITARQYEDLTIEDIKAFRVVGVVKALEELNDSASDKNSDKYNALISEELEKLAIANDDEIQNPRFFSDLFKQFRKVGRSGRKIINSTLRNDKHHLTPKEIAKAYNNVIGETITEDEVKGLIKGYNGNVNNLDIRHIEFAHKTGDVRFLQGTLAEYIIGNVVAGKPNINRYMAELHATDAYMNVCHRAKRELLKYVGSQYLGISVAEIEESMTAENDKRNGINSTALLIWPSDQLLNEYYQYLLVVNEFPKVFGVRAEFDPSNKRRSILSQYEKYISLLQGTGQVQRAQRAGLTVNKLDLVSLSSFILHGELADWKMLHDRIDAAIISLTSNRRKRNRHLNIKQITDVLKKEKEKNSK